MTFNLGFYSGKNLPEVRLQPMLVDRLLELAALIVWIILWVLVIYVTSRLPSGDIESKAIAVAIVATVGMPLMGYSAYTSIRRINFPFRVTERTVVVQYLLAIRFCRVLNVVCGLLFLSTALVGTEPVFGLTSTVFTLLAMCAAGLMVVVFGVYYVLAYMYK